MYMGYEEAVYDKAYALRDWMEAGARPSKRSEKTKYLGVVDHSDGLFHAGVFAHRGVAYVAIGCRVFDLKAAEAWWTATRTAYREQRGFVRDATDRELRADFILQKVLPSAMRWAKRHGLKESR